jgi:hypothetical protein
MKKGLLLLLLLLLLATGLLPPPPLPPSPTLPPSAGTRPSTASGYATCSLMYAVGPDLWQRRQRQHTSTWHGHEPPAAPEQQSSPANSKHANTPHALRLTQRTSWL